MNRSVASVVGLLATVVAQAAAPPEDLYNEPHRPQFHFTPVQQWMNDPNGMVYYQGEYHLFYQYHPYGNTWGPMHWGHAISEDLVHWEHLPIAIYPDRHGAIFSGSAVVDWNNTSGFGTKDNPPLVAIFSYNDHLAASLGHIDYQTQGLAYSLDKGRTWTTYEGNPVLKNPGELHFRDPKVFWYAPEEKWVMPLAVWDRISFYSSKNLKDWTFESDFGPGWGFHGGMWECPDLFELQVEGEDTSKWVLLVSMVPGGPNGGSATQYFVGDFDGRQFSVDPNLAEQLQQVPGVFPDGEVFEDFETDLANWSGATEHFELRPIERGYHDEKLLGKRMLSTPKQGDTVGGTLQSRAFEITQPYVNFYIGGRNDPQQYGARLVIDGKVVRRAAGRDDPKLALKSWDVREFKGKQAHIEIVGESTSLWWGNTTLDNIVFSDQPVVPEREPALWLDYGTDNYAGVTWSDVPEEDGRRLFIGWMGNWAYGNEVPTERWRSAMTLPRKLTLHNTPAGLRVFSQPVRELAKLRKSSTRLGKTTVKDTLDLGKRLKGHTGLLEMDLALDTGDAATVVLTLANAAGETLVFTINKADGVYQIDRTTAGKSDFSKDFADVQSAPIATANNKFALRMFLDRASLEVFVNDGETVMTALAFPREPYTEVTLSSDRPVTLESGNLYQLKSIWHK